MPSRTATEILSGFPGPVTLNRSRGKWLRVLAGCVIFAAIGFWMISSPQTASWRVLGIVIDQYMAGWLVLTFFGLGTITAAVILLPGAGALKLDRDGFEVTNLFRRNRTSWPQASGFTPARVPPANISIVAYDDARIAGHAAAAINVKITGRNAALNDTYGLPAEELAQLMTQWRDRAHQSGCPGQARA